MQHNANTCKKGVNRVGTQERHGYQCRRTAPHNLATLHVVLAVVFKSHFRELKSFVYWMSRYALCRPVGQVVSRVA